MRRTTLLLLAGAVSVGIGGCSNTEGTKTPDTEPTAARGAAVGTGGAGANLKEDDEFVRDVASKNMAELELSRIALEKSASPDVKAFAQLMIDDHGAAEDTLKDVVSRLAVDWPAELDAPRRKTADDLSGKQGSEFDRDYARAMIDVHQDLAAKLESRLDVKSLAEWKTAAAGRTQRKTMPEPKAAMAEVRVRPNESDNEITVKVNQWAADTYPMAQKHLDTARTLENAIERRATK